MWMKCECVKGGDSKRMVQQRKKNCLKVGADGAATKKELFESWQLNRGTMVIFVCHFPVSHFPDP